MKYIYLIAALLILNACGHINHGNHTASFKLKRAEKKEKPQAQAIILAKQEPEAQPKAIAQPAAGEETKAVETSAQATVISANQANIIVRPNAPQPPLEASLNTAPPFPDDSLEVVREAEEKLRIATKAEKNGKRGKIFGILTIITMFTFIFSFLTVPFAIAGLINSTIALKAPYITDKGLRDAKAGLIMSIIGLAITLLVILLIVALILAVL